MKHSKGKSLWGFHRVTGLWRILRDVSPETESEWLRIFQEDEDAKGSNREYLAFRVSKNTPRLKFRFGRLVE